MQISNNLAQLSFAFEGAPASISRPRGWSYLLADSVAFKKDTPHSIRIQKPTEEEVPTWIMKLITSGQCKTIYVENLTLKARERDKIRMLCHRYAVSIVNLQVVNDDNGYALKNVVMGPW